MKKGFVITLVSLSVFIIAILLLGSINTNQIENNYAQEFINAKLKLTNYELLLNQVSQDCNWMLPDTNTCIDNYSDLILTSLKLDIFPLTCSNTKFVMDDKNATSIITCEETITTDKDLFTLNISKTVQIRKLD